MTMLSINSERLRQDIEDLSKIGRGENHGIYRSAFNDADMEARAWLKKRIADAGLECKQDGAANVHAILGRNDSIASVMSGSHIDSVPGGGHLDGSMGVLAALECLRSLKEQEVALNRPVEAVAFADEEGRFDATSCSLRPLRWHFRIARVMRITNPRRHSLRARP